MDWATRRVLSWGLSNTLDARFCTDAFSEALQRYGRPQDLQLRPGQPVHQPGVHLGAQRLRCRHLHGRQGPVHGQHLHRPLWRSLKYEAVYLHEISDGFQAQRVIARWVAFYNTQRPHSALAGSTPAEAYERGLQRQDSPHTPPAPPPVPSVQKDVSNRTLAA